LIVEAEHHNLGTMALTVQPKSSKLITALLWARLVSWFASAAVGLGLILWLAASFVGLSWRPPHALRLLVWPGFPLLSLASTMLQMCVQLLRWRFQKLRLVEWSGWLIFVVLLVIFVMAAYVDAPDWVANGLVGAAFVIALPLMFLALRRKWRGGAAQRAV
jgi:hypothetical protein